MSKLPGLLPRMPNIARTGSRMPSMQKVVQSTRSSLSTRTTSSRSTLTMFSPGRTRCEPFIGGRRNSLIQQKSPRHSRLLFLSSHSLNHLRESQSGSEKQGWDENEDWSTAIDIAATSLHHPRKVARFLLWMRGEMDFHLPHRWPPWLTRKPHEPGGSLQDLLDHIHDPVTHSFRFKLSLSILSGTWQVAWVIGWGHDGQHDGQEWKWLWSMILKVVASKPSASEPTANKYE